MDPDRRGRRSGNPDESSPALSRGIPRQIPFFKAGQTLPGKSGCLAIHMGIAAAVQVWISGPIGLRVGVDHA